MDCTRSENSEPDFSASCWEHIQAGAMSDAEQKDVVSPQASDNPQDQRSN